MYDTTDDTFEEDVLTAPMPVLVDFWATWCGPCRALAPTLERIAQKFTGRLTIVRVDIDQNPALRRRYRVMSVPQLVLFADGREAGRLLGAHSQGKIEALVAPHLAESSVVDAAPGDEPPAPPPSPPQRSRTEEPSPLDWLIQPRRRS